MQNMVSGQTKEGLISAVKNTGLFFMVRKNAIGVVVVEMFSQ